MQLDAAQVCDPGKTSGIVHDQFLGRTARWECKRYRSQPGRAIGGGALLIEGISFCTIDKSLQDEWSVTNARKCARRDREIVAYQVEL